MPSTGKRRRGKQGGRTTPVVPSTAEQQAAGATAAKEKSESSSSASTIANAAAIADREKMKKKNLDLILTSEKRRGVYECDYCRTDISQLPRIRCAAATDFDLCLDCFTTTDHAAAGARLRAAVDAQRAVDGGATGGAPPTKILDDDDASSTTPQPVVTTPFSLGYRVCDSTRYPLFAPSRNVTVQPKSEASVAMSKITRDADVEEQEENNDKKGALGGSGDESGAAPAGKTSDEKENKNTTSSPMEVDDPEEEEKDEAKNACDVANTSATASGSKENDVSQKKKMPPAAGNDDSSVELIFTMDDAKTMWTVEEDLRLLDGIKNHGLGNWVEIAESVAGQGSVGKTPKKCQERYLDDYLGRYGHILPPYQLIMEDFEEGEQDGGGAESSSAFAGAGADGTSASESQEEAPRSSKRRAAQLRRENTGLMSHKKFRVIPTQSVAGYDKVWPKTYLPKGKDVQVGQEVGRDQACRAEQSFVKMIGTMQSSEEVAKVREEWSKTKLNQPGGPTVLPPKPDDVTTMSGAELAGFMPRRGDFDVEYENEAEQAVADMDFLPNECEQDKQLKLQVLAIYNSKLDERDKRKEFVLSRKLWDYRKVHQAEQKLPRDERDLVHRMRLFERFHTPAEHQKFLEDILKAKKLRKEIAKLQMYRRIGIRTLAEAEKYELDKSRRTFHKSVQPAPKDSETGKSDATGVASGESGRTASFGEETVSLSMWKQYRTGDRKVRKSLNRGSSMAESTASESKPPEPAKDAAGSPVPNEKSEAEESNQADESKEEPKKEANQASTHLLLAEISLCEKLNLGHDDYLVIKKALIYESLSQGLLDKESSGSSKRTLIKMDVIQRDGVLDFFLRAGWVSSKMGDHVARIVSDDNES